MTKKIQGNDAFAEFMQNMSNSNKCGGKSRR